MRKSTILPVIALGALTLGTISTALPAGASTPQSLKFGVDGDDDTTPDTAIEGSGSGSGSGASTPSGGASTGAGGMADGATSNPNFMLWLAAGGAGLALVGSGAIAARRRYHFSMAPTGSSTNVE